MRRQRFTHDRWKKLPLPLPLSQSLRGIRGPSPLLSEASVCEGRQNSTHPHFHIVTGLVCLIPPGRSGGLLGSS
jgi:hypothetical protein